MRNLILAAAFALVSPASAFTFSPPTTTDALNSVNTSAASTWTGTYNGKNTGDAAAGNVSRIPITTLLPSGNKVVVEMQDWWCVAALRGRPHQERL